MCELTGCRQLGSEAEEEDIRHHQRTGRSGVDREEKQEHNPMEVGKNYSLSLYFISGYFLILSSPFRLSS